MRRLGIIVVASLVGALLTVSTRAADGTPPPWTYFTVSGGTKIAAAVRYPVGFDPDAHDPLPVLFMMDGYGAGGSPGIDPAHYGNAYITVHASIRGTGCSGGVFNLFDRRHAEDGHEIITNHLPALPGSNGNVGIIGHSYPGLTGWMVAATNPPNLRATAISGLIDDLYRPDQLRYELEIPAEGEPLTIAGPINMTLTASSTAVNTDFFVGLLDVNTATGETLFLQRGLLRASHREINPDPRRSDFTPGGEMYRAWRPHHNTTTKLLTPGRPYQFEIEVFPVGHVFRPGHKLVIQISAPPPLDPLSSYAWASGMPPAVNTVHHDPVEGLAPSSILLPVAPNPAQLGPAPACGAMIGVPCFTPADRAGGP